MSYTNVNQKSERIKGERRPESNSILNSALRILVFLLLRVEDSGETLFPF